MTLAMAYVPLCKRAEGRLLMQWLGLCERRDTLSS